MFDNPPTAVNPAGRYFAAAPMAVIERPFAERRILACAPFLL
jgi:hypothetical protein